VVRHLSGLATKKNVSPKALQEKIEILKVSIIFVPEELYTDRLEVASNLVRDPSDRWFAALALKLAEEHGIALILTYNKRDYRVGELERMGVRVLTPGEAAGRLL
jgi:predicted nucleic acid-binding protein